MVDIDSTIASGPLFASPDEILAHPAFPAARRIWVDALLDLYGADVFLSRLLSETTRSIVYFHVLTLDAMHDPADRATWPTLGLLQKSLTRYGLASPRRIEALVSRLVETRYVTRDIVDSDHRVRLLTPTDKMLAHDLDWLKVYYAPLAFMFPACGYAPAMRRDPLFRVAVRRASHALLDKTARLLASNPDTTLFMNREAGMLVLSKLVQSGADQAPVHLVLADLADRFGISRTHARRLLRDGERSGLLRLADAGITLERRMTAAFDRFVADCMSAFDLLYRMAMNALRSS